jgi:hypothetical protein
MAQGLLPLMVQGLPILPMIVGSIHLRHCMGSRLYWCLNSTYPRGRRSNTRTNLEPLVGTQMSHIP